MVKVFQDTEKEFYMDGYMKAALDVAKREIKNDWDFLFVYDGVEGSGKSTAAMQHAFYCDPSLSLDRYAFTPMEFHNVVMKSDRYQAVVYDEAWSGLNSRQAMSKINRSLISMLTQIRQKNLFVFIVLPTFFDLDKYVALWRSRALIHIYAGDNWERGSFLFFNAERKKQLYLTGKKLYDYAAVKSNFYGSFTGYIPLDIEIYKKRKYDALVNPQLPPEIKDLVDQEVVRRIMDSKSINQQQKGELLGKTDRTFRNYMRELREKEPNAKVTI